LGFSSPAFSLRATGLLRTRFPTLERITQEATDSVKMISGITKVNQNKETTKIAIAQTTKSELDNSNTRIVDSSTWIKILIIFIIIKIFLRVVLIIVRMKK